MNMKKIIIWGMIFSVVYSFNVFGMKRKRVPESEMTATEKQIEEDAPAQKKRKLDKRYLFPRTDELDFVSGKRDPISTEEERRNNEEVVIPIDLVTESEHFQELHTVSRENIKVGFSSIPVSRMNVGFSQPVVDAANVLVLKYNNPQMVAEAINDYDNILYDLVRFVDCYNVKKLIEPSKIKIIRDLICRRNLDVIKKLFKVLPKYFKDSVFEYFDKHLVSYAKWILTLKDHQNIFERLLESRDEQFRDLGMVLSLVANDRQLNLKTRTIHLSQLNGACRKIHHTDDVKLRFIDIKMEKDISAVRTFSHKEVIKLILRVIPKVHPHIKRFQLKLIKDKVDVNIYECKVFTLTRGFGVFNARDKSYKLKKKNEKIFFYETEITNINLLSKKK